MEKRCFLTDSLDCRKENKLFLFPFNNFQLMTTWLQQIPKQLYTKISNPSYICESHFESKFVKIMNGTTMLSPNAVPTNFDCASQTCRFCLKPLLLDEKSIEINNYIKMQFFIITDSELNSSEDLSQHICEVCFDSACDLASFKTKLLKNQKKLEDSLTIEAFDEFVENDLEIKDEPEDFYLYDQTDEQMQQQFIEEPVENFYEEHLEEYIEAPSEFCIEVVSEETKSFDGTSQTDTRKKLCPQCGKSYSIHALKRHHERVHLRLKKYHCDYCNYKSYSRSHIEIHVRSHLKIKSHFCDQCGAAFGSANILRQHFLTHKVDRPFQCEEKDCGISFKSIYALRRHGKTHNKENKWKFQCEICCAKFTDKWHLKRHQKNHEEQSFPCDVCGKIFGTEERVKAHQVYHRPPQFPCNLCTKEFYKKPDLTAHMKIHTGQKDWKCEFCNNSYFKKAHLHRHMKTHEKVIIE